MTAAATNESPPPCRLSLWVSLCSPGQPLTFCPPASASHALDYKPCTSVLDSVVCFKCWQLPHVSLNTKFIWPLWCLITEDFPRSGDLAQTQPYTIMVSLVLRWGVLRFIHSQRILSQFHSKAPLHPPDLL